jgi:Putative Actinobacterial Holin-X, holin superfamily III
VQQNGVASRQRHLGELVSQLAEDAGTLVRQEVELAKLELRVRVQEIEADLAETAAVARAETREKSAVAKSDIAAKAKAAASGAGMFGAAGGATLLALGALTACAVLLLSRSLPADVAAGVVAAAWALIAAILAAAGRSRLRGGGTLQPDRWIPRRTLDAVRASVARATDGSRTLPTETIETVKEDVQWVKTRGKSDAR